MLPERDIGRQNFAAVGLAESAFNAVLDSVGGLIRREPKSDFAYSCLTHQGIGEHNPAQNIGDSQRSLTADRSQ